MRALDASTPERIAAVTGLSVASVRICIRFETTVRKFSGNAASPKPIRQSLLFKNDATSNAADITTYRSREPVIFHKSNTEQGLDTGFSSLSWQDCNFRE
jgi:hypothetical protein